MLIVARRAGRPLLSIRPSSRRHMTGVLSANPAGAQAWVMRRARMMPAGRYWSLGMAEYGHAPEHGSE